jgi:Protein of unknown function (DUF3341)
MSTSHVLAEFRDETALCAAARRMRELGHRGLDAYSPVPVHGIDEALGLTRSAVPLIALIGGVTGAVSGYVMQWWMNGVDYALNVGNRLPHSPPTNIPITFEMGVLIAAFSIVIGMILLSGLPRLYHPVFEVEAFRTASVDGFWLAAEVARGAEQPALDELRRLGAVQVSQVAEERP